MIKSKFQEQVDSSLVGKWRENLNALFAVLLAVLMLAGVWGTTVVFAAPNAAITPGQTFTVFENSATNTVVGQVLPTGQTNYTIESGNSLGAFFIDANTGIISVADGSQIDFETTPVFTLAISVNGEAATGNVTIEVVDLNDPPEVNGSYTFSVDEGSAINSVVDNLSASDPDGNTLNYAITLWIAGSGEFAVNSDGDILVASELDYETDLLTTYVFVVEVSDGGLSTTTVVTVNVNEVNDPPVANDDAYTTDEDDPPLTIPAAGVLANDTDQDDIDLTAVLDFLPANGVVSLNVDGSFTYTPTLNFDGVDSFTYFAFDGSVNSDIAATVTITVTGDDDPPVADGDSYSTNEDTQLSVDAPGVLDNDSDPENGAITAINASDPPNGTVVLDTDGSFVYTPDADFNGTDTFTYEAHDGNSPSSAATVTIDVVAQNDPPTADDDSFSTNEDTPLSVPANGVLGNDDDIDFGDSLTAINASDPPNGTVVLDTDGSFVYTPDADFNGTDTFTYQAYDGVAASNSATVTITVDAVNDPPTADDDSYSTNEDTPLSVPANGVLGNDDDIDVGDSLTAINASDPPNGTVNLNADGSFTYTPDTNFNGTDTFTYQAYDSAAASNSATVTITVDAVNDPPSIENQLTSVEEYDEELGTNGSIVGTLVYTVTVSDVEDGNISNFGTLPGGLGYDSFDIDNNDGEIRVIDTTWLDIEDTQSFTLTVVITDSGNLTDTAIITIDLIDVNEFDPQITANQVFTIAETATPPDLVGSVGATDEDWEDDFNAFSIIGGTGIGLFAIDNDGNITVAAGASFDYEGGTNSYTLDIEVEDDETNPGTRTGSGTVSIDITDVNDAPVIDNMSVSPDTINENDSTTITIDFSDQDTSDAHTVDINWGDGTTTQVSVNAGVRMATDTHTYNDDNPSNTNSDSYTISVTVTDDGTPNESSSDTTNVTVNNVAPQLSNIVVTPSTADEGDQITLSGDISDASSSDSFSLFVDWGDGTSDTFNYGAGTTDFSETHTLADDGDPITIALTLTDDDTGQDIESTTLTVNNVAPTVEAGPNQIVNVNDTVDFAGSFSDPGTGDTHTIEWDFDDTGTDSGSLTPQHAYSAIGVYTATLTVTDDDTGTHSDQVVITVVSPSDMAATKTVRGSFEEEGTVFYTITMINNGDSDQLDNAGDELTDVLPSELALVGAQVISGGGTASAVVATNTVTWNGSIASGSSVVIEIEATILPDMKGEVVSNQATIAFDADGNGSNEATTYSDDPAPSGSYDPTVFNVADEYLVFLPIILNNATFAPDLVVTDIRATSDLIEVVIENQGNAPVVNSFWVDFYINPNPEPMAANDLWPKLGSEGLAWGITDNLAVGASLTLVYSTAPGAPNQYFVAKESLYYGSLPAGTAVFAQVDSAHAGIDFGAVAELDEIIGEPYNNILGGTAVPVASTSP